MKGHSKVIIISVLVSMFLASPLLSSGDQCCYPLKGIIAEIVEKAVFYYRDNGRAKTFREINKKKGRFVFGSVYVFAYNLKGTIIAHPFQKNLIGKDVKNWIDEKGNFFRKDILLKARNEGEGWVSYQYMDPVARKSRMKHTFVRKEGNIIFCCGFYTDKKVDD